jgi:insulysin
LTIFKYLSLLRVSTLEKYHHDEISALGEIHFRFTEKERAESYVSDIACSMNKPYMREHLLSGGTRVWDWDEGAVGELLNSFRPEKSRVSVLAKEFKDDSGWEHETWYKTEYRIRKMDEALLKQVCEAPCGGSV